MLDHHLQRGIIYRLAFAEALRFSDLKPDVLENKLFTYHLKKVLSAGYVEKDESGLYRLTPEGRRLGVYILEHRELLVDQPESVLFLVIRRKRDDAWLLYRRKTHPLKDRIGFMHAQPAADIPVEEMAAAACREKTGLTGIFRALGGGYFRVYEGDQLESYTHFTLLVCEDAEGELNSPDELAEYYWDQKPDFTSETMLPNMSRLSELYGQGQVFFVDETIRI